MVSLFAKIVLFSFWPKSLDYRPIVRRFDQILCTLITPHCKVLCYGCRYIYDDAERQWSFHERNNDNYISWDEYADTAYGMVEGDPSPPSHPHTFTTLTQS